MIRTNELMNGLLTVATYRYYFFSRDDIDLIRVGIGYIQDDGYWCICQLKVCPWAPSGILKVLNRSVEPFPGFSSLANTRNICRLFTCTFNSPLLNENVSIIKHV